MTYTLTSEEYPRIVEPQHSNKDRLGAHCAVEIEIEGKKNKKQKNKWLKSKPEQTNTFLCKYIENKNEKSKRRRPESN